MHPGRAGLVAVLGLGACGIEPRPRPPALGCLDGGCVGGGGIGSPGGGGVVTPPRPMDAGVLPPPDASPMSAVSVSGDLRVAAQLPPTPIGSWLSPTPAMGWQVRSPDTTLDGTLTDATGRFELRDVPTRTTTGAGAVYLLEARSPRRDLNSLQLFRATDATPSLYGISTEVLLAATAPSGVIPDDRRSQVVFFVVGGGAAPMPQAGVTVALPGESVVTLYDDERGQLSMSLTGTGPQGVAVALNATPGAAGVVRMLTAVVSRGGRMNAVDVPLLPQTVTWVGVAAP
ncbi:MAG: hypothetical protein HY909_31130 [Deltaproteobacteria bacterium]|nr:hypothetical protein [Deltaproteobacteria bacterium]